MFAAYPGDIIFSKIDARGGAIGVLQESIAKAVVTSEFPVFVPASELLAGKFVKLVLRTGNFLAALRAKASGTSGRKRIAAEAFADLRIPLPPLSEQQAIVAAHQAEMDRAAEPEREADETETQAMMAFETALGFTPPPPLPDRPVFIASFKDLDRWSHEGVLRRTVAGGTIPVSPYPTVQLRQVIADLENGWSPKGLNQPAQDSEWGVLKLGAVSFGVFNPNENKALPRHLNPRPHLEIAPGQLLISRANITRLVGATVLIEKTRPRLMLCDKMNQRRAVLGADAALVLILSLFGEAAEEDQIWNYEQITGKVWQDVDLYWDTSTNGVPWNAPYRTIQRQSPPKGMSPVSEVIKEYEKTAPEIFSVWGEQRPEDTQEPWGEYRLYTTKTALALGESVYNLIVAGMYGAAFALARTSWESAANAHYVWNEIPNQQVLRFLLEEHAHESQRIPLPKSQAGWKHPIAKKWARMKGTRMSLLAELANGERVQGQRWAAKIGNPEHCPYSEGEITNLVRFAAMNLMFLKAGYFHFDEAESMDTFERLMDRWEPEWPIFQVSRVK